MKGSPKPKQYPQAGFRIEPWGPAVGVSRSQVYEWVADGTVPSVKIGGMRIITISPQEFIAAHTNKAAANGRKRVTVGSEQPEAEAASHE